MIRKSKKVFIKLVKSIVFSVFIFIFSIASNPAVVFASSVTDSFADSSKISTGANYAVSGGQVSLSSVWYDSSWRYRKPITLSNSGSALSDYQVLLNLDTASLINDGNWYNASWGYRKKITVTNSLSENLGYYQVLLDIDTQTPIGAGKMKSDCSDIRITDSDMKTLINYWIESGCNTSSTKIWARVPAVPALSSIPIYLYYGKSGATSVSSIANTFLANSIFQIVASGGAFSNHTEADSIRQNNTPPIGSTAYTTSINDSSGGDNFNRRYRFLFVPSSTGSYGFGANTDDSGEVTIFPEDGYGGGVNTTHPYGAHDVTAYWYGSHGSGTCGSSGTTGSRNLTAGQGYWIDFLMGNGGGGKLAQMCINDGSWKTVTTTNFTGEIYARSYPLSGGAEPTSSIGSEVSHGSIGTAKMLGSCADMRFTSSDKTTLINHWVESGCNTSSTKVWVKVPSIPNGNSTIYLYYGNSGATSTSSISNTFINNSIFEEYGSCSNGTYCNSMDNHSEADYIRQNMAPSSTSYQTTIDVTSNSTDFFRRYRYLFVPSSTNFFFLRVNSDDGSELGLFPGDGYGGGLNTTHPFGAHDQTAYWYGSHGGGTCGSSGTRDIREMTSGQGYWMDYLMVQGGGGSLANMCIYDGGSWKTVNTSNFSGQLFSRKYPTSGSEPTSSVGSETAYSPPTSGWFQSTNLMSGISSDSIDEFTYTTSLPGGSAITVQFSNDGSTWYNSSGTQNGTDTLNTGSNNTIVLHNLGWSGSNFYYKIAFTGDGVNTPALDDITVNYTISSSCDINSGNYYVSNSCAFNNIGTPTIVQNTGSAGVTGSLTGTTWVQGKYGSARSFNGAGDYVAIPDKDALDPTEITAEAWIYFSTSTATAGNIVSKTNSSYRFRTLSNDTVQFLDRGATNSVITTATLPHDTWTHVAVTGDSGGLKIYFNGVLKASNTVAYGGTNVADNLVIGCYYAGDLECFNGQIDDVRIYNYARTASQIEEDMNSSLSPTGTAPVLNMTFDDGYTTGVDNGNLVVNSYKTVTVNAGQTLVWNPGQSITIENGGSLAINTGAQIKQQYLYVLDGNSNNYYFGFPVAATSAPSSNYIRYYQAIGKELGSAADGNVEFTTNTNLNTWNHDGRTCADGGDGVYYNVSALTSTTATLASTPSSGCLSAGDRVLLINMRGTSSNYTNAGHYEMLEVSSVSTNTVTFTSSKTKYYGNGASDDTNLGTGSTNQIVMLQRVPQYGDVTVDDGVTLTATSWTGSAGGVLALISNGTLTVNPAVSYSGGIISMNNAGYPGGLHGSAHHGGTGGYSYNGQGGKGGNDGVAGSSGQGGGGGGGGGSPPGGSGTTGGAGGGSGGGPSGASGGGGYGTVGKGGGGNSYGGDGSGTTGGDGGGNEGSYGGGGGGGGTYGDASLSTLFLGSGSGGSGGGNNSNGADGELGGGIIYLLAKSIVNNGTITANGQDGVSASGAGGSGGGAGGSIKLVGTSLTLGSGTITATGGTGGNDTWDGGNGGSGRIAVEYITSLSGTTNPTGTSTNIGLDINNLLKLADNFLNLNKKDHI